MGPLTDGRGEEVDEKAWAACRDPDNMLELLRSTGKLSERKAQLFACAAVRRVWHPLADERTRKAVEVAESYADGLIGEEDRLAVVRAAINATWEYEEWSDAERVAGAACSVIDPSVGVDAAFVANQTALSEGCPSVQADLLRDIVAPHPFRSLPPLPASARTWNDGLIVKLATAVYEERTLPEGTLDSVRLGVLADALEEAGVTDEEVLGHLRRPEAVHVRGCHLVDLLLHKW